MPEDPATRAVTRVGAMANRAFLRLEIGAYLILGILLSVAALIGMSSAAATLWRAVQSNGDTNTLVLSIDRLLLVLMVVEILHTVRESFRAGMLICEPFLIVGLIASIRRVLVITLESSQANQPGKWSADSQAILNATMLELAVLGLLILIMVFSIYMLRHSDRHGRRS